MPAPTVFPIRPSGRAELTLEYGYPTDIFRSDSGSEQRRQLASLAHRALEIPAFTVDERDTQIAESLVYSSQGLPLGVPLWPFAQKLTAQAASGATSFSIPEATPVPWPTGGYVLLFQDARNYEALRFNTGSGTTVTTLDPSTRIWPTGTLLLPLMDGRLDGNHRAARATVKKLDSSFRFDLDPAAAAAVGTAPVSAYLGYDLLDLPPRAEELGTDGNQRLLLELAPATQVRAIERPEPVGAGTQELTWICQSRSAVAALLAFLADRRGRAVPFWLPTWRQDLTLSQAALSGASTLRVHRTGYGERVFPTGPYRRRLALRPPGGTVAAREVLSVTDMGDGTEQLTLQATIPADLPLGSMVMHLMLCRLDRDLVPLEFTTTTLARATFPVRELPLEVPPSTPPPTVSAAIVSSGVAVVATASSAQITGIAYEAGDVFVVWGLGDQASNDFHIEACDVDLAAESEVASLGASSLLFVAVYRPTAPGTGSVRFTSATVDPKIGVGYQLVRGLAAAPVDKKVRATGSSASPDSGNTATTTQASEFLAGAVLTEGPPADAAGTWADAFVADARAGATPATLSLGHKGVAATGAYRAAKTGITARPWAAYLITLKAA